MSSIDLKLGKRFRVRLDGAGWTMLVPWPRGRCWQAHWDRSGNGLHAFGVATGD